MDLLDLYGRASAWTLDKTAVAATMLDAPTPCDDWDVSMLMNHMLDTQRYFIAAARGEDATLPAQVPPALLGEDPAADFRNGRDKAISVFGQDGVIEKTGPAIGIAFSDQLLHGWDLAKATGRDATMPEGLAASAYEMIHGRFTDEQRKGVFGPEIPVPADASAQDRLLGYSGRRPGGRA